MEFTNDKLLDGTVLLRQPKQGYRVAIDPVFLAASVPARPGERVLDVGAGVGAAALCLAHRIPGVRVDGIEFQRELTELARQNATINIQADRVTFHCGNVVKPPRSFVPATYDHVMTNPPFMEQGRATHSSTLSKTLANIESAADIETWVRFCATQAVPGGTITFIYNADRLDHLLAAVRAIAGAIVVFPLWPKAGKSAKRVIVRAQKGIMQPTRLEAGLVLHSPGDGYSKAAEAILRGGAPLEF
ncbi:MAG: tRNA1(Val) (adenine(37)-N6)-methyltransferase [Sphingomonadales bacterium]